MVKKIIAFFLVGSNCCVPPILEASSLGDLLGSETSYLQFQFKRYEFDGKTGKLDGPFKGDMSWTRPGHLRIDLGEQQFVFGGGKVQYRFCADCDSISLPAEQVLDKAVIELIALGTNSHAFFDRSSMMTADAMQGEKHSLAAFGFDRGELEVWFDEERMPLTVAISLKPGTKTWFQLYGVKIARLDKQ